MREQKRTQRRHAQSPRAVRFIGRRDDVPKLLKCFDAFWLTSMEEGTPNSILEAMAAGVPVVATDVGGNSEIIEHGANGFLVPLNDIKRMADHTMQVLIKGPEREKITANARRTVRMRFDMARMVEDYDSTYRALYGGNPCRLR